MADYRPNTTTPALEAFLKAFQGGSQEAAAGARQGQQIQAEKQLAQAQQAAALHQLITGKQMDLSNSNAEKDHSNDIDKQNFKDAQQAVEDGAAKGRKVNAKIGNADYSQAETNPYLQQFHAQQQQAGAFDKMAGAAYKPINEQLTASRATLDALNQGNASSDKLALINEARLAAGQGGSRAIAHIVDTLSGGTTAAGSFQDKLNWLQNTPNIPTMQPGMRDAIRESVFNRIPQLDQQHQQAQAQLTARGASVTPMADTKSILGAYTAPADSNLNQLKQYQQDYMKQRQGAQNPISQPATANPNPTTMDKLKSFFGGGQQQAAPQAPQAQTPAQAPAAGGGFHVDPAAIAAEIARRKAAQAQQPQSPLGTPAPQGGSQ